jgi:hypothetical protein
VRRSTPFFSALGLLLLLVPSRARADEAVSWASDPDAVRIGGALSAGFAYMHRSTASPGTAGGAALGGDLHVHPYSMHGFYAGYTTAGSAFGPSVSLVDTGYSLRLGNRRLKDSIGVAYLDLGPALGVVSGAGPEHATLGGHAGVTLEVRLWHVTAGLSVGYRGGVPLRGGDGWEGSFDVMARVGVIFDVAPRAAPAPTSTPAE